MTKKVPSYWVSILAVGLLAAFPGLADDCDHTAPREDFVDAGGAERVIIDVGAGSLKVNGREGADVVQVRGEACASSEKLLEDIQLRVERSGDRVRIVAEMPDSTWGSSTARLDLDIEVPAGVEVAIDDGSGEIEVRNVGSLDIDDGSGEIEIEEVAGDVRIDDGSGEIEIKNARGEVRIEDGSGEIELRSVGSVVIEDDGSGEIDIVGVAGDVMVRSDGSGSITVRDVGGDFTVRNDGSGDIHHDGVAGRVSIPEDKE